MATLTNITKGAKGVNTSVCSVLLVAAGASINLDAAGVSYDEAADLVAAGWFDLDDSDDADGLGVETVADLKALAELEAIDLGAATKKADIIAAIRAARLVKAGDNQGA